MDGVPTARVARRRRVTVLVGRSGCGRVRGACWGAAGAVLAATLVVWVIPPGHATRKRGETTPAADLARRANLWLTAGKPASSQQMRQGRSQQEASHVRT